MIGPLAGGFMTDAHTVFGLTTNWRWIFFINVPVGIVATFLIAKFCPPIKHDAEHHPDYAGAALLTVALSATVLAVDNTEVIFKHLISSGLTVGAIKLVLWVIAVVCGIVFLLIERRAKQPILPLSFFANRNYRLLIGAMFLFGAAFLGAILYLTQFNQQVFGATASQAGLMLLPMTAGMMITSIGGGQMISRTGHYKRFALVGMGIAAMSIASLILLEPSSPYWHEAIIMFLTGFGLGFVMPVLNLAVQNEFDHKDLGAATSSVQLFRGLGSTIGTALLSGLLTAGIVSGLGQPANLPFIQSLQKAPQAQMFFENGVDADTVLNINMQKQAIRAAASLGLQQTPAPPAIKNAQFQAFIAEQDAFSNDVVEAFAQSLHRVFVVSGSLMAIAFCAVLFVREKPLRNTATHAAASE